MGGDVGVEVGLFVRYARQFVPFSLPLTLLALPSLPKCPVPVASLLPAPPQHHRGQDRAPTRIPSLEN